MPTCFGYHMKMTSPVCARSLRLAFGLFFYFAHRVVQSDGADATTSLRLQHFTLQQLQSVNDELTVSRLHTAVMDVGIFAVTGSEKFSSQEEPFGGSLHAFALCAGAGLLEDHMNKVVLGDGTIRSTFATTTNKSVVEALPATVVRSCPVYAAAAEGLRQSVDRTGQAWARMLDRLIHGSTAESVDPIQADSFLSAVQRSESLEHFHLFHRTSAPSSRPSLEMHADMGLFIIMTAAEYFDMNSGGRRLVAGTDKPDPGLLLQLPGGQVVRPEFDDGSLLVMSGEGIRMWMRSDPAAQLPHVPLHEMLVPDVSGAARAWFGRMFLPPRDAILQHGPSKGMTFNEYREQTYNAFKEKRPCEASTAGCDPARRSLMQDEGSCGAGQMYCWMSCMSTANLACDPSNQVCSDPSGGLWPQDYLVNGQPTHCFDCAPQCTALPAPSIPPPPSPPSNSSQNQSSAPGNPPSPAPPPRASPPSSSSGFCNTRFQATVMWMTGFQLTGDPALPCVAFLFKEWVLSTKVKFGFACAGTFFMGIVVPALGAVRKLTWKAQAASPGSRLVGSLRMALLTLLYLVQMTLAYFLMLLVMTYQAELFITAVLGLTFGHFMFDIYGHWDWGRADSREGDFELIAAECHKNVDPCCCD